MVSLNWLTLFLLLVEVSWEALTIVYWVQTKEYRWDRFRPVAMTVQGILDLKIHLIVLKSFSYLYLGGQVSFLVTLGVLALYLYELKLKGVVRPVFTLRAKEVYFTLLALALVGAVVSANLAFIQVSLLISPFIGVYWSGFLVARTLRKEIAQAGSVLSRVKPLVIGVTGSYGKSTTKEFIATILSSSYKVVKTQGSENTLFGVVRTINQHLTLDSQVLVAELGAYKRGEIANLAGLIKPRIGVITGVEPQHLDLFGSLENIQKAKYELVESLGKDGIAVINFGNDYSRPFVNWAKHQQIRIVSYKVSARLHDPKVDLSGIVLKSDRSGTTLEIKEGKNTRTIQVNLPGVHFAENVLAALLVARLLGLSWEKITKSLAKLSTNAGTFEVYKSKLGAYIIDDSLNSTPKAFKVALDYLANYEGSKMVFTSGIIELGNEAAEIHKELGSRMAGKISGLILTKKLFAKDFKAGLANSDDIIKVVENKPARLHRELITALTHSSVVLFEGRMPFVITSELAKLRPNHVK